MTIKGLLEMMFEVVSEWIDDFLTDIEMCHNVTPRPNSRRQSSASGSGSGGGCECAWLAGLLTGSGTQRWTLL